jgi:hypothetical protein
MQIVGSDRGNDLVSLSGLTAEELHEFENLPGLDWLLGAHLLVRTNGFVLGASEPKQVIVVCDTAYRSFPQYRFWRGAATHAIGYSDGSVARISPAEYASLDLRAFQDVNHLKQKSRVGYRRDDRSP